MGWEQPEPGSAEECKLASWYSSHRQIFFLPSRTDFPGLPFHTRIIFPPEKVHCWNVDAKEVEPPVV